MNKKISSAILFWSISMALSSQIAKSWDFENIANSTGRVKNVALEQGVAGNAALFNGYTSEWEEAGITDIPETLFIEAWVAPLEYSFNVSAIVNQQNGNDRGFLLGINQNGQLVVSFYTEGKQQICISDEFIPILKWSHVACAYQEGKGLRLFINGTPIKSLSFTEKPTVCPECPLVIGKNQKKGLPAFTEQKEGKKEIEMRFNGLIDELKIAEVIPDAIELQQQVKRIGKVGVQALQPQDKYTNETNVAAYSDGEFGKARQTLANWQSYLADDVLYKDVILPASHNAGTLKTKLFGLVPIEKLNCQEDDIFSQLMYGVRSFDLRFAENPISKIKRAEHIVYICHGSIAVAKYSLKNILENVRDFNELYPDEFVLLCFNTNAVKSDAAKKEIAALFEEYLPESKVFLKTDVNPNVATVGQMRESGKSLIVNSSFYANAQPFTTIWGSWSAEYNFSDVIDRAGAVRLYAHYRDILNTDVTGISFSTNRARSGESLPFRKPYDFMINDRSELSNFYTYLEQNPALLSKIREMSGDFMTHDYFQTGKCILLNNLKGNTAADKQLEFSIDITLLISAK